MVSKIAARYSLVLTLAALLGAAPAAAQGKGKGNDKARAQSGQVQKGQQARPQLKRRAAEAPKAAAKPVRQEQGRAQALRTSGTYDERYEDERYEDERYDDRYEDARYGDDRWGTSAQRRDVPPGWCRGKGNPHNTPENCGYNSASRNGRVYDDYDRNSSGRYGSSYEREHADFHYYLDRKYSDLADDRPLDPVYQIRLRADKKAEHDRWHQRTGTRHQ